MYIDLARGAAAFAKWSLTMFANALDKHVMANNCRKASLIKYDLLEYCKSNRVHTVDSDEFMVC